AGHFGMNRAKVGICSWLAKCVGEPLVGVEHLGLEQLVVADHRVRDVVAIYPSYRCSRFDRDGCRSEAKVVDLDFGICSLSLLSVSIACCWNQHCGERRHERQQSNCAHTYPHDFSLFLSVIRYLDSSTECCSFTPRSNQPPQAHADPARSSRWSRQDRFVVGQPAQPSAQATGPCPVGAGEKPSRLPYGKSHCLPPSAAFDECGRSAR